MATKRQIIKALDAAGFTGVEIHYYRNVEGGAYWAFFGGEADDWDNQIADWPYCLTLADSVEAWIKCAHENRSDKLDDIEIHEDDRITIITLIDNSATFIP